MKPLFLSFALLASPVGAATPFGPFASDTAPVTKDAREERHAKPSLPSADPMWFAFRTYQLTLSATDGPRCAHSPTCSAYGVQAVRRHRAIGYFLTADRLWRGTQSSALRLLPPVPSSTTLHYYDPVEASDFWISGVDPDTIPEFLPPRLRQ